MHVFIYNSLLEYKLCRGKQSGYDLIKDENQCFSSKPENLEVIQNLTEHGLVDISVKWKGPKRPKQGGIYGYNLTVNKISNGQSIDGSICYITRRYGMPFVRFFIFLTIAVNFNKWENHFY